MTTLTLIALSLTLAAAGAESPQGEGGSATAAQPGTTAQRPAGRSLEGVWTGPREPGGVPSDAYAVVDIRKEGLVIVSAGVVVTARWRVSAAGESGASAAPTTTIGVDVLQAADRQGRAVKGAPKRLQLEWTPAGSPEEQGQVQVCGIWVGDKKGATECFILRRVIDPQELCFAKCMRENMARAVSAEVIENDCRRSCGVAAKP